MTTPRALFGVQSNAKNPALKTTAKTSEKSGALAVFMESLCFILLRAKRRWSFWPTSP